MSIFNATAVDPVEDNKEEAKALLVDLFSSTLNKQHPELGEERNREFAGCLSDLVLATRGSDGDQKKHSKKMKPYEHNVMRMFEAGVDMTPQLQFEIEKAFALLNEFAKKKFSSMLDEFLTTPSTPGGQIVEVYSSFDEQAGQNLAEGGQPPLTPDLH